MPNGPVYEVAEGLEDPQTVARGDVVGDRAPAVRHAPFRGEDTDSVLSEICGYSAQQVAQLRTEGGFGERESSADSSIAASGTSSKHDAGQRPAEQEA